MKRVLVVGGSGTLGQRLVPRLRQAGYTLRVMSRSPRPGSAPGGIEWAQADLATGAGLAAAVGGCDVVIHAATATWIGPGYIRLRHLLAHPRGVDVEGTRRLIEQARAAQVEHLVYVSIVGIEHFASIGYFRSKLEAEKLTAASGLPWTIVRATQFYQLVDTALAAAAALPVMPLPTDFKGQAIDPGEVAARIVDAVQAGPAGRLPDVGGPEVLDFGQIARAWLAARGLRRRMVHLPFPGKIAAGFRRGLATCPQHPYGRITWGEWLQGRYGVKVAQA